MDATIIILLLYLSVSYVAGMIWFGAFLHAISDNPGGHNLAKLAKVIFAALLWPFVVPVILM